MRPAKTRAEKTQQVSDSTDRTVLPNVILVQDKLPGALEIRTQPEMYYYKLMKEERPDLIIDPSVVTKEDIELLCRYNGDRTELQENDIIYADNDHDPEDKVYTRYEILLQYNEGRYSGVYLVQKRSNTKGKSKNLYMLKLGLRRNGQKQKISLLREIKVLKELSHAAKSDNSNFPVLVDTGKVCDMEFIVLTLFDMNLDKLRESIGGSYSPASALFLGYQCLTCIMELHSKGFIHRDIKPSNFCIGLQPNNRKVFMIDFGEAVPSGKNIRAGTPDYLTLPYYSLGCHKNKATTEHFDYESWFYMLLDFLKAKPMDWKNLTNEEQVVHRKEKFWNGM
ncbi:unnamed protein product [Auanema sp. JU1783]|nr:unnamed protein product [Auanema sp. JU1783]